MARLIARIAASLRNEKCKDGKGKTADHTQEHQVGKPPKADVVDGHEYAGEDLERGGG